MSRIKSLITTTAIGAFAIGFLCSYIFSGYTKIEWIPLAKQSIPHLSSTKDITRPFFTNETMGYIPVTKKSDYPNITRAIGRVLLPAAIAKGYSDHILVASSTSFLAVDMYRTHHPWWKKIFVGNLKCVVLEDLELKRYSYCY